MQERNPGLAFRALARARRFPTRKAIWYTGAVPTSRFARPSALKRWLIGRVVMGVARLVRALPDPASSGCGVALGDALYFASPRFRSVARTNLRQAFGSEWTDARIHRAMKETF